MWVIGPVVSRRTTGSGYGTTRYVVSTKQGRNHRVFSTCIQYGTTGGWYVLSMYGSISAVVSSMYR